MNLKPLIMQIKKTLIFIWQVFKFFFISIPLACAVHDDGHVPGKPGEIDLPDEAVLFAPGPDIPFEAFPHG
jgi:hypothetical protein